MNASVNTSKADQIRRLSRRGFLHRGALFMAAATVGDWSTARAFAEAKNEENPTLRIGLVTDLHHADRPAEFNRFYREAIGKFRESIARFNEQKVDFAIELGDFIDQGLTFDEELGYLKDMEKEYARFNGERHYVLGNHCVWALTKKQFLENCGARREYYSFEKGDFHFVVLDACFREDEVPYGNKNSYWLEANIPEVEQKWLKADLNSTKKKTFIFVHQRLDLDNGYGILSAPLVRRILKDSGKVVAVFHGHNHLNFHQEIDGIHYCTMEAMIEGSGAQNNAYAILDLYRDGSVRVEGFRKQHPYVFKSRA